MTQEEQIKQVAEYDGWRFIPVPKGWVGSGHWRKESKSIYGTEKLKYHTSLDWLNPVWVKINIEIDQMRVASEAIDGSWESFLGFFKWKEIHKAYHYAIDTGNISAALTAVSDAITWLKEQKNSSPKTDKIK